MANEYLKRTPTSTGNRSVFTWSGWVKRNSLTDGAPQSLFTGGVNGSDRGVLDFNDVDTLRFGFNNSGWSITETTAKFRDPGSWMNVILSVNLTTSGNEDVSIYVNGIKISSSAVTWPSIVNNVWNAAGYGTYITSTYGVANAMYEGEMFDVFWVDGQALTPDVFGFYKDGDGYVSAGTTQATDFRPGQWMPHSPTKIKKDVNRRGGFGVNGFYLPMNDSSNPGADFHCAPNSIITLKGEDLPQPRNGAPTTSDAYVSQLRQETGELGFDGAVKLLRTGGYLNLGTSHSDLVPGSGDFTIECFLYPQGFGNFPVIVDSRTSSGDTLGFFFGFNTNGQLYLYTHSGERNAITLTKGKWYHIALVRQSNVFKLYVDGVKVGTDYTQSQNYTNQIRYIGESPNSESQNWNIDAFISNFRFVKGTAVYTANFTPPTEPLTAVTNTKLLCCNSSTSATAATVAPGTITAVGGAFATRNELTGSTVLAVPGASTATGANLVTNGHFDTNTSGWSSFSSATLTQVNGTLKVECTGGDTVSAGSYNFATVNGQRYTVSVEVISRTGTTELGISNNSTVGAGANILSSNDASASLDLGLNSRSFTATGTTTYIGLWTSGIANAANTNAVYDNVVVKQEDAPRDYSADIKGSGTNNTLTAYDTAGVGYELGGYYGSAMQFEGTGDDDYFDTGYSIDGTFGSGDYTIECWIHTLDDQGERGIFGMFGSQYGISMRQFGSYNAGGNQTLQAFFGQSAAEYRCGTTVRIQDQWNHVAMVKDGTIGTLYLNGVAVGIADNVSSTPYSTSNLLIGIYYNGQYPYKGYIQDFRVYTTAKYKGGFDVPKPYTPVGIEEFRTTADTCKNNFATFNPLIGSGNAANDNDAVLKDGNLFYDNSNQSQVTSTIGMSSGKWYAEYHLIGSVVSGYLGVVGDVRAPKNNQGTYNNTGQSHIRPGTGSNSFTKNWTATSLTSVNPAHGYASGDIFGFALDLDSSPKNIKYFRNGSLIHTDSTIGDSGHYYFLAMRTNDGVSGANWADVIANFGQNPSFSGTVTAGTNADDSGKGLFKYAPPSGFLALCEDNLPTPAIADPGKHFKTVLWTGNPQSINVGFTPDLVWMKGRSSGNHGLFDSVRGATNRLTSNLTDDESSSSGLLSFDNNGFSKGTAFSASGSNYVAWCWKAGGAAVSNTDGSITSQVSVNQDAGFSIVKFTAQTSGTGTVGHGLSKKPAFWIYKPINNTTNWYMYHQSLGASAWLNFTSTDAETGSAAAWGGVEPTSTVLTHGSGLVNQGSCILYAWAEIEGYSKFGSYVANNSGDGPFVYCGFKPAWVLVKNTTTTGTNWELIDNVRSSSNGNNAYLIPNDSGQEYSTEAMDLLSNGFKLRTTSSGWNSASGNTYVFAAFAESPFQTANAK